MLQASWKQVASMLQACFKLPPSSSRAVPALPPRRPTTPSRLLPAPLPRDTLSSYIDSQTVAEVTLICCEPIALERPSMPAQGLRAHIFRNIRTLCARDIRLVQDIDRKSVVEGKSVDLGGRRIIKKKT